ncbi:MAG TPA: SMP-30/gluconolactonase/LRE family protein [Terriglobia bacterium]|nr:SMP-30/gluconolactonase/LRE family protein [Terriglobia bacterium]
MVTKIWVGLALLALAQPAPRTAQEEGKLPREVSITAIPDVIDASAKWQQVWQGTDNADGIVGTNDGGLLFAQEQPSTVRKLDKNDKVSVYVEDTHGAGALAIDSKKRILAVQRTCTDPGREKTPCSEATAVAIIYPEEDRKVIADNYNGAPLGRLNDLVVDKKQTVYFTSGPAYYVKNKGKVVSLGEDLRTNGIMLNPDETRLYVTNGGTILVFDIQPNGFVNNRREFAKLQGGNGDGMCIDALGRLYVTSAPGVQVFDPQGKYLGTIPTPRNPISVAFSGKEKKMLYIVGSGALGPDGQEYKTPPGVRNNGKTIYKIPMLAEGFKGRPK